jgi:hypothetical protein
MILPPSSKLKNSIEFSAQHQKYVKSPSYYISYFAIKMIFNGQMWAIDKVGKTFRVDCNNIGFCSAKLNLPLGCQLFFPCTSHILNTNRPITSAVNP